MRSECDYVNREIIQKNKQIRELQRAVINKRYRMDPLALIFGLYFRPDETSIEDSENENDSENKDKEREIEQKLREKLDLRSKIITEQ